MCLTQETAAVGNAAIGGDVPHGKIGAATFHAYENRRGGHGEESVRIAPYGLLLLVFAFPAFARAGYVETWNPPEAQGGLHQTKMASKPVKRLQHAPRLVRKRSHQPAIANTKPHAKPRAAYVAVPHIAPHVSEISPVTTSDGNPLRVGSDGSAVQVNR